jgi:DNA-binding winged helix-turn-helix (wHTH) protein
VRPFDQCPTHSCLDLSLSWRWTRQRRLLAAGVPAVVDPRAFDVLIALVERAGHLVTKEELFSLVWPRLVVEENNLQVQISALRKILGPAAIATVSGQGYRFTLEVSREVMDAAPPAIAAKSGLQVSLRTHTIGPIAAVAHCAP